MKFLAGLFFLFPLAWSQTCAPRSTLQPADSLSGTLDSTNCRLSDNTLYSEYSLVLPTRGQIELDGVSSAFDLSLILRDANGHRIGSGSGIKQPVERGQYSVLVNAGSEGQAGAFTLRSSFTPEPGSICRDFAHIGLNQALTGRLSASSCLLPDNTEYDG